MAKDPAFLFYSKDFLTGVAGLTMEERGQYITLLCMQHQSGHLSEKQIQLSVGNAPADVRHKFRQDSAGLWYNERLDAEIERRKKFSRDQSDRANKKWEKVRKQKENGETETSRGNAPAIPGVTATVNADVTKDKIESQPEKHSETDLADYERWTQDVEDNNDFLFGNMLRNSGINIPAGRFIGLVKDHLQLLARYPKMRPQNQQAFRYSLIKHITENKDKQVQNGTVNGANKTTNHRDSLIKDFAERHGDPDK